MRIGSSLGARAPPAASRVTITASASSSARTAGAAAAVLADAEQRPRDDLAVALDPHLVDAVARQRAACRSRAGSRRRRASSGTTRLALANGMRSSSTWAVITRGSSEPASWVMPQPEAMPDREQEGGAHPGQLRAAARRGRRAGGAARRRAPARGLACPTSAISDAFSEGGGRHLEHRARQRVGGQAQPVALGAAVRAVRRGAASSARASSSSSAPST